MYGGKQGILQHWCDKVATFTTELQPMEPHDMNRVGGASFGDARVAMTHGESYNHPMETRATTVVLGR